MRIIKIENKGMYTYAGEVKKLAVHEWGREAEKMKMTVVSILNV